MKNKYEYSAGDIDTTYDAFFAEPLLDLHRLNPDILKRFYEVISPRYTLPLSGLQSFGGNSFADIKIRVELFDGRGIIELTPQKLAVNFTGISSPNDIKITKDCITLALDALHSSIPDAAISGEIIGAKSILEFSDNEFVASEHLDKLFQFHDVFDPEPYGATSVKNGLRTEFSNPEELWQIFFMLTPKSTVNSSVDFSLMASYELGSTHTTIDEKTNHIDKITDAYLDRIGLIEKTDADS